MRPGPAFFGERASEFPLHAAQSRDFDKVARLFGAGVLFVDGRCVRACQSFRRHTLAGATDGAAAEANGAAKSVLGLLREQLSFLKKCWKASLSLEATAAWPAAWLPSGSSRRQAWM